MLTCIDPRIPTKEPRILRPPRLIRVERLDIPPHVRKVLITHSTKSAFDARNKAPRASGSFAFWGARARMLYELATCSDLLDALPDLNG